MSILSVLVLLVRMGFTEKLSTKTVSPVVRIPETTLKNKGPGWEAHALISMKCSKHTSTN